MNIIFVSVLLAMLNFVLPSITNDFSSQVFIWEKTTIDRTKTGNIKEFLINKKTNYLEDFQISGITINPNQALQSKCFTKEAEKLVIVKEGQMELTINGRYFSLGSGSVILTSFKDDIEILNNTTNPLTFYLLQWKPKNKNTHVSDFSAKVVDWQNVEFKQTEKGGVRNFLKVPTDLLSEFEMHVTTLNKGIKSHDPHTHTDDEIILVKSGMVEEIVNNKVFQMGEGSFILLNGNEPHGIRNIGNTPCEYFAFRFK